MGFCMDMMVDEMLRARKRASDQLCVGSILVLFGFIFAGFVSLYHFNYDVDRNFLNKTFSSGYNYFPSTISESVADPKSDLGKVFFGFNIVGAIIILLSQY